MKTFHKAPLAIAIAALMAAPYALAEVRGGNNTFDTDSYIDSKFDNKIDVEVTHDSDTYKNFYTAVFTVDFADNYSGATVDSKQLNNYNSVENNASENNASLGGNSLRGSSGNVGVNVAAGDNNSQANDAALSASDAEEVFGQAAAFSAQSSSNNIVANYGSPNSARLGGNSLQNATGNIGVNAAAGVGNAQQNSLAASANTSSGSADATTGGVQTAYNNYTNNALHSRNEVQSRAVDASFNIDASGLAMDQIGNVYPDMWSGSSHTGGTSTGHFDLDTATQGGSDLNGDGGALAFMAAGDTTLEGTISGEMPAHVVVYEFHSNDASLGGNSLRGASGNIGVNVAAGSNNLQRNSLAIASASGGGNGGGNGGGE
ncbi:hypothetical protein [Halomonas sp. NO4]|uniref:hypothetical protein n=1 Tax=Halomonas sp. NO4 TaxID=2484813 RepID=UPI0013D40493|nr:hypothetical protein [Halomonas sp. NO4]